MGNKQMQPLVLPGMCLAPSRYTALLKLSASTKPEYVHLQDSQPLSRSFSLFPRASKMNMINILQDKRHVVRCKIGRKDKKQ